MPKINQEEYEILKGMGSGWKWLARESNGNLYKHSEKPMKLPTRLDETQTWLKMDGSRFLFIKSTDEPYSIAELIKEYEYSTEHVSHVVNERVRALGKAWSESEETEVKDIEWLKEEVNDNGISAMNLDDNELVIETDMINEFLNQLDEPETLSQNWIDENAIEFYADTADAEVHVVFRMRDLQNLLVPKQEEVDRAYKDGYEKGKQYTFYKGYLEGVADKENEPETVADVISDFWKSFERLKEVMSMEVEELEE